ncbi:UNVERIFIED_CONTAM: DNL zinc finger protein [Hammondia hammondi]|eukprot:XP_008883010.1 DNL zinc finger protein [Hammondia hammondi]
MAAVQFLPSSLRRIGLTILPPSSVCATSLSHVSRLSSLCLSSSSLCSSPFSHVSSPSPCLPFALSRGYISSSPSPSSPSSLSASSSAPEVKIDWSRVPGTGARKNSSEEALPAADVYVLLFTCKPCGKRSVKKFSKRAYHHGVVIIKCPHCESLHLIADHLGWFGAGPETLEDILKAKGEKQLKALSVATDLESRCVFALSCLCTGRSLGPLGAAGLWWGDRLRSSARHRGRRHQLCMQRRDRREVKSVKEKRRHAADLRVSRRRKRADDKCTVAARRECMQPRGEAHSQEKAGRQRDESSTGERGWNVAKKRHTAQLESAVHAQTDATARASQRRSGEGFKHLCRVTRVIVSPF